jgi:redox-sensitive bicupin YhaK (pirin superfamily)
VIDHTDSRGNAGRYGGGDLQWMTAGDGVVHGEMFPLVHQDRPNTLHLFQIWLNLPAKHKRVKPHFIMHWDEDIPHVRPDGGRVELTVWAGEIAGATGLAPPPKSWAAEGDAEVAVWFLRLKPGGRFTLPPARGGSAINRSLYFFYGNAATVAGRAFREHTRIDVNAAVEVELAYPAEHAGPGARRAGEDDEVFFLVLQGRPIGEPVVQHGPFVMNTQQEIMQAFQDYQSTQFGGWPWPKDAMVHPREKGRFCLVDGKESYPGAGEGGAAAAATAAAAAPAVRVRLAGLSAEAMNGREGVRGRFFKDKGRFEVVLDAAEGSSENKKILVKAENIVEVEGGAGGGGSIGSNSRSSGGEL